MRSLSFRILLSCFCTMFLSSIAFFTLFAVLNGSSKSPRNELAAPILQQGIKIYRDEGRAQLKAYLASTNAIVHGDLHLVDVRDRDLVTGQDDTDLLKNSNDILGLPKVAGGRVGITVSSPDKQYQLVGVTYGARSNPWLYVVPYYLIIAAATALVCWLLTVAIVVSPVRNLANIVERFGAGDFSVRAGSSREDEIGGLSRTFNAMAERIQALLSAERRLLEDISHELRSPLARLRFAGELVRTTEDRDTASDRIKKDVSRLTKLVDGLLQVVRPDDDPAICHIETIPLADLCRDVIVDCSLEARMRACEIRLFECWSGSVCGDRELLRRAVENVLRNAVRYAPSKTDIDFSIEQNFTDAVITVRDYGPGVPDSALPHIFEPFFRADKTRQKSTGGIGLGLSIARRSIQVHRGKLIAENAAPGLRVQIVVPFSSPYATQPVPEPPADMLI